MATLFVHVGCSGSNQSVDSHRITEPNRTSEPGQSRSSQGATWLTAARPLKFTHLSTEHGLSQNTVLCALQDRQGFMWFGTQDGLNRFDGYDFTIYRHNDADPGSLRDNYILSLYEDRAGVLWVGTNKGGLNRYDRQTEQFTAYVNDPNDAESLSLNAVNTVWEDPAGYLWVATDGQGLNRFDRRTGKFKRFVNDPAVLENRRLNIVNALHADQEGTLWLGTSLGLSGLNLRSHEVKRYAHNPNDPQSLSHNRVQSITEDRTGTLWLGTPNGLNRFDRASGGIARFQHDPANPYSLAHNDVQKAYVDQQGRLWLGTSLGLDRFDTATGRFTHHVTEPAAPHSLSGNRILALYEDRAGSLWVSAQGAGLNRYDSKTKPFINFAHDPGNPHSLTGNAVSTFFEDRDGHLLVSTNAGVNQFDPATGQFSPWLLALPNQPAGKGPIVSVFAEDRAGRMWLGTGSGLYRIERQQNGATQARYFPTERAVHAVCITRDGMTWVGTHGGGLLRLDPETGQITTFLKDPHNARSLTDNLVYAIHEDQEGILWIGADQGLNRLDRATGQFTRFVNDPQNPASLSYNLVWSINEDRAGRLWIGTGGGLNLLDRGTQQFRRYTEKDGLPNANVMGILEDEHGQLWLGTMNGLARFDPQTGSCRNYDRTDGLFGNEINQNAHYKNRQGVLFFGGMEGFTAFHPEQIQDDLTPPPIVLTACHRYNTDAVGGVALTEKGIAARSAIEFSYKDNILSFEFAALSFLNPEKNQYAYQLAGYSDRWIQLGAKHDVTFTNLDAGNYTLHVRGSNSDGVWNTAGTSLRIRIVPPFWRRWWFVGLELLAVAGLALGAYRWRVAALHRRNAQQQEFSRKLIESQEQERKRIAAELHDSLGQELLIIKNRVLLNAMKLPDEQTRIPFNELSDALSHTLDEVRTISYDLRPPHLDQLGLRMALVAMIEKVASSSPIQFTHEIGECDGRFAPGDEMMLYRIVQECLNNIIKHSEATEARLELRIQDDQVLLTIRDNGRGFRSDGAAHVGLGLQAITERTRILGGTQTIHSTPGQGTTVTVRIDLKDTRDMKDMKDK